MIKQYIADLKREFSGYSPRLLGKDAMSGLTVAAVALPLALAFGVGSGASAAAGLITAILSGIMIGALSGASFQISGPTGAMTAILIAIVLNYGLEGMLLACLMAGVVLLIAGLCKLGRIVSIIPMPVVAGFTSGIAIVIALSQADNLFGVTSHGTEAIERIASYFVLGFNPNLYCLLFGGLVILIMLITPKKVSKIVPASLIGIVCSLVLNAFLKLDVPVVGTIPTTLLPDLRLTFENIRISAMTPLLAPALSIAALGMIESLLCGASAGRMKNERLNGDRELVSQGIGNIIIPFFGGVPATAAIARTSVAIKSGAVTRLAGIFHALVLLLSMFFLADIMSQIPLSALAGVLIVTAWRMNDWECIQYIFKRKFKSGILEFLLTMVATVVFDLTVAIIAGLVLSALVFVIKSANLTVQVNREEEVWVHIAGPLFFATSNKLTDELNRLPVDKPIVLDLADVYSIDTSGMKALVEYWESVQAQGGNIRLGKVNKRISHSLERGGIVFR